MRKLFAFGLLLGAALALAEPMNYVPRTNGGNPQLLNSGGCPSIDPHPETSYYPPTGQQGQSQSVPGAIHLAGCGQYRIWLMADGGNPGYTSNITGGTVTICSWPEFPLAGDAGANLWSQNPQLKETVPGSFSGQTIQFAGHASDGMGWIYAAATNVSTLQPWDAGFDGGTVSVFVEARCVQ